MSPRTLPKNIARATLITVVLLSTIGVVGTAFFNHAQMQDCPFAGVYTTDCVTTTAGSLFVFHHIEGFQSLYQNTVTVSIALALIMLILVLGMMRVPWTYVPPLRMHTTTDFLYIANFTEPPILQQFQRWYASQNKLETADSLRVLGSFA